MKTTCWSSNRASECGRKRIERNSSPKNLNSVIIYSPSSSSKPLLISLYCRSQRKIFWRKFVTKLFWGTIDFHRKKYIYYGRQWCPRNALFPIFFKISSFVFSRTKTFIQVLNHLRGSKLWQNFHVWVNYPFKWLWTLEWLLVPDGLVWVFEKLLIYWDFYAQQSLAITKNGPKKRKYPVSGSCVDENALLMSEVRGEWADWSEMIERQQQLK